MAIKVGDAILWISGNLKPLKKDLAEGKKQTTVWTQAVGVAVGNLMGQAISGGVRLATGAVKTLGKELLFLTMDAAKLESTANTFKNLAESIGGDAAVAMEQLREATRGMIADADLMQAGNKFLAMGLADTTQGAADLAEMATQLGTAMGEDATSSMENFALMMANQSIPRLDSFGISSSKVRERIKELQEATEGLSREQAFNQAVTEQGVITMEKVGEQAGTSAAKIASLRATLANLRLKAGQALQPVLDFFVNFASGLVDKYGPKVEEWLDRLKQPMVDIGRALQFLVDGDFDSFFGSLSDALVALGVPQETLDKLFWFFKDMWAAIQDLRDGDVEGFIQNFRQALYDLGIPIETIDNVEKALRWLIETWDKLKKNFTRSKKNLAIFGDALKKRLAEPLDILKTAFSNLLEALGIQTGGDGTFLEYLGKLLAIVGSAALEGAILLLEALIASLALALNGLAVAVNWLRDQGVFEWFGEKIDELSKMTLPWWLTPGSPTPLENAIRGIGEAAAEERANLEKFFNVGGDGLDFSALERLPESMREAALLIKTAMEEGRVVLGKDLTAETFTPLEAAMRQMAGATADEQKRLSEFFRFGKQGVKIAALDTLPDELKAAAKLVLEAAKEGRAELFEDFTFEIWDPEPVKESIMSWKTALADLNTGLIESMKGRLGELLGSASEVQLAILKGISEEQLEKLKESATEAQVPLDGLTQRIRDLALALVDLGVEGLPSWLTPGSPTPLELGLRGITDAITDMPSLQAAFGGLGQGSQDNRRNVTVYGGIQNYQTPGGGNPLEDLWNLGQS